MPNWIRENYDYDETDHLAHPDDDLSWRDVVELSRERGGSTFKKYRVDNYNYDHHGEVYSGPVNWFICLSMNKMVTSMDEDIRRYHVLCMTPWANILHAHNKSNPYEASGISLIFDNDKERGLETARKLANRELDPKKWKWF